MVAFLHRSLVRPLLSVCLALVLSFSLTACSSASNLSGNYVDDTVSVATSLLSTITIAQDDPGRQEAEGQASILIKDYVARYRPRRDVHGLGSFTTMQTALNSLAAYYSAYANRPLPDALRARLEKELKMAESGAMRGA
ncbi:MAG: photosystem II protein Psb27 [Cyanobacteria bacterium]|nr:photosystem II protein Psb27 [Cyanobacteriota bacterium]